MASAQQLVAPQAEPVGASISPSKRQYVRYLLWALSLPAVLWLAAFPLVCSRSYETWGETEWGPVLEFPYQAGTPDADLVVWGDSSAFIGVDPRLVNAQLGMRSVVLPSTVGSLPVIGDEPLRTYLAHHRQPRLIVLYFSAWNLDFAHAAPGRRFEGEEMMLRHSSASEIIRYGLQHPVEWIAFPIRLYSTFGSKMLIELLHGKSRARDTAWSLGHAPFDEPYGVLQNLCRIPDSYLHERRSGSVEELRRKYSQPGTEVMVYLAPVPDCSNSGELRRRSFAALGAEPPALLPPTDFSDDRNYAHIWPGQVPVASTMLAEAVRRKLLLVDPGFLGSSKHMDLATTQAR